MRRISFGLTKQQVLARTKTVTRRVGWGDVRAGDRLLAVDRVMGFKKGERPTIFGVIEVISMRGERVDAITKEDCDREGFPRATPAEFVDFFCKEMKVAPEKVICRIEFRYLPGCSCPGLAPPPCPVCAKALRLPPRGPVEIAERVLEAIREEADALGEVDRADEAWAGGRVEGAERVVEAIRAAHKPPRRHA